MPAAFGTVADLTIRGFADELLDRELDASTWEAIAKAAIEQLHHLTIANQRLRETNRRLREDSTRNTGVAPDIGQGRAA